MKKRYTLLTDDVFRKSKYIKTLQDEFNIKDFRKEQNEQYKMILGIYQTLILLNNCFFSDSNISNADKVENALSIIEKLIYINIDENERKKYTARDIRDIIDKKARQLYNYMIDWHYGLESLSSKDINNSTMLKSIKDEINEEMNILRNAGFDSIVQHNIEYKKNSNKNYKDYIKYISKFDDLFNDKEAFIDEYKNDFYSMYGITLTDNDIAKLSLLYALIGKANNGLINVITDYQLTAMNGITKKTTSDEASYKIYLHSIGIDYTSNDYINHQKLHQIKHSLLYHHYITLPMNKDKTIDRIERHCQIMRFSDLLFFYYTMEKSIITKEIEFSINSNIIDKIVNDLTSIYENLKEIEIKKISKEEMISNYFIPNYNKLQEMILRNKNLYERVS